MSDGGTTRSPDEVRAEIEDTRERLGETVEALAHKADVKGRAHERVEETRERIAGRAQQAASTVREATPQNVAESAEQAAARARENPVPLALAGAFAAGVLLGVLLRSRRS